MRLRVKMIARYRLDLLRPQTKKSLPGMASATVEYVVAVANRFPYTADISPQFLVAFGSHKLVSLWNLHDENTFATLPGHEGVVTCVRFINESCFVSGDDKGVLRCWNRSGPQVPPTHPTRIPRTS